MRSDPTLRASRLASTGLPKGMIPAETCAEIQRRLAQVEEREGVRILLAVESGSRAWGFASPDSDSDVRFIYCRPQPWYLSVDLEEKRDVLEYGITDDIDMNGWDLRKALRLLWKSNPVIVEWLQSPIEYQHRGSFRSAALALLPRVYSPMNGIHHYRSMAKTNYREYLRQDSVRLKKYFYVLRPLLAARWIEARDEPPPIEFEKLLSALPDRKDLLADIMALLEKKKASGEMDLGPPVPSLNAFIEAELERLEGFKGKSVTKNERAELLNDFLRSSLSEAWNNRPDRQ
jgi:predicted nucleotidyltransferase